MVLKSHKIQLQKKKGMMEMVETIGYIKPTGDELTEKVKLDSPLDSDHLDEIISSWINDFVNESNVSDEVTDAVD